MWAFCAALCALGGWKYADTISTAPPPLVAGTQTIHDTRIVTRIKRRVIKVRVPAKIIRRHDDVIVWQTARYVFVYRGRRRVIPPHIVRVRYHHHHGGGSSTSPPIAAVVGVAPAPTTITVPVTVFVPGPTSTLTLPPSTTTITLPPSTTTVTVPPTTTLPATSG